MVGDKLELYFVHYDTTKGFSEGTFSVEEGKDDYVGLGMKVPKDSLGTINYERASGPNLLNSVYFKDKEDIVKVKTYLYARATEHLEQAKEDLEDAFSKHSTFNPTIEKENIVLPNTVEELQLKLKQMYNLANNAIYFDDSSDYLSALYDIAKVVNEDVDSIGENYIDK